MSMDRQVTTFITPWKPGDVLRDTRGNEFLIEPKGKEKTMAKRLGRKQRKLHKRYRKLPRRQRNGRRDIAESAAVSLGVDMATMAAMYQAGGKQKREVREALQAAASKPGADLDDAMAGERDWATFFDNFMECFEKFLPLILAI